MLSTEEKEAIEKELTKVPKKRYASLEVLKCIQEFRGWISDDTLQAVADYLELKPDELESVATFYNLIFRKPVGRHVILICDSISCWVLGYENINEKIKNYLGIEMGQTTGDNRFTLLPIPCLGTCDHAPAMMVDHDLYRDLTEDKVEEILGRYQ